MRNNIHPNRFVWDFWYHYDDNHGVFHIFYLNADKKLAKTDQHHFNASVGYAKTKDFSQIEWIKDDVFSKDSNSWDNSSIWSGDVIKYKNGYLFFYTSRDKTKDDGFTQNIGLAFSKDFLHWERIKNFRLKADERWYEPKTTPKCDTVHAFRDPYLFMYENQAYMLISAKDKNAKNKKKGCIALYQSNNNDLTSWKALPPLVSPEWYEEMEVPRIYFNNKKQPIVSFSCWAKYDYCPYTNKSGGLQSIKLNSLNSNDFDKKVEILSSEEQGIYAGFAVSELNGEIVGFCLNTGSPKKTGIKTKLLKPNRCFDSCKI